MKTQPIATVTISGIIFVAVILLVAMIL